MDSAPPSICKVCQGIFQEGHRRRFRLRQIGRYLWESKVSSHNQDTTSDFSGENGQATIDPLNEEADDDVSKRSSDEEEDLHWSSDEEDLDEEANEDAPEGVSDEEEYFRGYDYFVYMHYPNLAMLQKSAEHGHCRSCHVLTHSLRSGNSDFDEFLEQAQELEAQRLQKLQSSGDRAQFAVLDEDESDPNLDSALQMHIEVRDNTASVAASISPKEHGEGRLFLTFEEKRLDHEFLQNAKLDVFCKPTEYSDSGHLVSEISFLGSPGECEFTCSWLSDQV